MQKKYNIFRGVGVEWRTLVKIRDMCTGVVQGVSMLKEKENMAELIKGRIRKLKEEDK